MQIIVAPGTNTVSMVCLLMPAASQSRHRCAPTRCQGALHMRHPSCVYTRLPLVILPENGLQASPDPGKDFDHLRHVVLCTGLTAVTELCLVDVA